MAKETLPFVHLHVHTEYSMLDGLNRIPALVSKVKESGMNSVAITDHGVMYGVYEFWKACKDAEIKPIIGAEIYVAPTDRKLRSEVNGIKYYHLILLAKNLEGYHNLIKLVSIGHLEGFYYRPRVDREILEKYSKGIICSSGCPVGPLGRHIVRGEEDKAKEWLEYLYGIYKDDFYLEIQRHGFSSGDVLPDNVSSLSNDQYELAKEEVKINIKIKEWSRLYKVPLIASCDAHYLDKDDELSQEIAFAIKDGKTLEDADRRHAYKKSYVKTPEEMHVEFLDVPEALKNTQKVADKVEVYDIVYNRIQPKYPDLPKGVTAKKYLEKEVYAGVKKRYGKMTHMLKERVDMELKIIHDKGYDDYFLVVSDMMKWARKRGILVGVRGSVAGSVASYCLDISDIEPIRWELYFERFLNPERKSPPDIDMDLQDSRREEVINYVIEKYGRKNIAAIAAFGRLKTRAAIRDVCRVMKIDLKTADILSKMVHVRFGRVKPISLMLQDDQDFRKIIESDPRLGQMAGTVARIEGLCRHVSTHACGYLITPGPVTDYVPVQYETGSSKKVITQVEFKPIEDLGLMKFDFLGLINLTIIDYAIKLIKKRHNIGINVYQIPEDDKKTMKLFQDGNTTAVFQFESDGIKRYLRELKPENMEDLCFMAAAYRPGPMQFIPGYIACKHGIKKPEYLISRLEPILKMTYGFAIYQEQVIRIAVDIAGYSMGEADILRRAMGKKIPEVMRAEEDRFVKGCKDKGYSEKIAKQLFEYLKPFADYGFNKSHSAGYAYIAYWTAYLKAHYPIEFMCARMTADMNNPDKLVIALKEARAMGLNLLPPDINKSHVEFSPEGKNEIRYGLDGIKNVGRNIVEDLINERDKNGEFTSLNDFCARVSTVNSRTLESLIKVGALSAFGECNGLLNVYPSIMSKTGEELKAKSMGQLGLLFQNEIGSGGKPRIEVTKLPDIKLASTAQRLEWEKDLLGIYFTSHPLQWLIEPLRSKGIVPLSENVLTEGKRVIGLCVISTIKQIKTKKGDSMAFVTLDDMRSPIEGVLFPKDWLVYKDIVRTGDSAVVSGRCNKRNDQTSIILDKIKKIEEMADLQKPEALDSNKITLIIDKSADSNDLEQLRDMLVENPGDVIVNLHVTASGKVRKFKMKEKVDGEFISNVVSRLRLVKEIV